MTKVKSFDSVALTRDFPTFYLKAGDVGTVVEAYEGDLMEVEFIDSVGDTVAILTLNARDLRKPAKGETLRFPERLPEGVEPPIADATVAVRP